MGHYASEITGIILAGGKSRRMGADKAFQMLGARPLISYVIAALERVASRIILIGSDSRLDLYGLERFSDLLPGIGPLGGLFTGLTHSRTELNLVLGCDTPLITAEILEYLLINADPSYDVVQLADKTNTMPLIACYRRSGLIHIEEFIQKGNRRMQETVNLLNVKTLRLDPSCEMLLRNINSPEDLKQIRSSINK